jgi:predicted SprT family Zn-dependent metalloprotease
MITAYAVVAKSWDIEELARSLMDENGLQNWTFAWNRRTGALGVTNFRKKQIELSSVLIDLNGFHQAKDTILHEIAHALAGPEAGHGPIWQAKAREVGANPRARADESAISAPPKVVGTCPNCSTQYGQQRMPRDKTKWGCPACKYKVPSFDDRRLVWSRVGEQPDFNKAIDDATMNLGYGPNRIGV